MITCFTHAVKTISSMLLTNVMETVDRITSSFDWCMRVFSLEGQCMSANKQASMFINFVLDDWSRGKIRVCSQGRKDAMTRVR